MGECILIGLICAGGNLSLYADDEESVGDAIEGEADDKDEDVVDDDVDSDADDAASDADPDVEDDNNDDEKSSDSSKNSEDQIEGVLGKAIMVPENWTRNRV